MDYQTLINLKMKGLSNQRVADSVGVSRETVRKHWIKYCQKQGKLVDGNLNSADFEATKDQVIGVPAYDSSNRKNRKYTAEIDQLLDKILEDEEKKARELTTQKQRLTSNQIYQLIRNEGHDIGRTTITNKIREKRNIYKECFIAQSYEYGDRFEFDFGEAELIIGGKKEKIQMAVIACPASGFRWAHLYRNQKMEVFLDSLVRFFNEMGGGFKEGVFDNMRNAVSHFSLKEKIVNEELSKISRYYSFHVNLTNARKGNEKGTVEGAVKVIRQNSFAVRYTFESLDEAQNYLQEVLAELNSTSKIEEEKKALKPIPSTPYETAQIVTSMVNSYSFIRIDNNFYSVPERLIGKKVKVKKYPAHIVVYDEEEIVAEHSRLTGKNKTCLEIFHYLGTLYKKPGAIKNSKVLKQQPVLEEFFNKYFIEKPKEFIDFIRKHQDDPFDTYEEIYRKEVLLIGKSEEISAQTESEIEAATNLFVGGK